MITTEEILEQLYQAREGYRLKLAEIDVAISALEGKQIQPNKKPIVTNNLVNHKPYPKDRLAEIINEKYNSAWNYSDQIMWLLVNFGGMTPADMGKKVMEFIPDMPEKLNKKLQGGLGYRAKEMVNMGQLEFRKQGYFNYYWVSTPELLALKEN